MYILKTKKAFPMFTFHYGSNLPLNGASVSWTRVTHLGVQISKTNPRNTRKHNLSFVSLQSDKFIRHHLQKIQQSIWQKKACLNLTNKKIWNYTLLHYKHFCTNMKLQYMTYLHKIYFIDLNDWIQNHIQYSGFPLNKLRYFICRYQSKS